MTMRKIILAAAAAALIGQAALAQQPQQQQGPTIEQRIGSEMGPIIVRAAALAAQVDQAKTIKLVGTVKQFQWTNPHSWIQLDVANAEGAKEEWAIEGNSPNQLIRLGWRPGTLKPGDTVTVMVKPMRDGAKGGMFVEITLADGTVLKQYDR